MALDYPHNVIWYIEARRYEDNSDYVSADPQAMGSAVAVNLKSKQSDGTWMARKYLLTCGHVVRDVARQDLPAKGWGRVFDEICCFNPGRTYMRTQKDDRKKTEKHRYSLRGVVSDRSPLKGTVKEVPRDQRLAQQDWVLLEVLHEDFQHRDAVELWAVSEEMQKHVLLGYPSGAGTAKEEFWKDGEGKVESLQITFDRTRSTPDPGMLLLDGDKSEPGMSGGGVFLDGSLQFVGLHRASTEGAQARHSIAIQTILNYLFANHEMLPVEKPVETKPLRPNPCWDLVTAGRPAFPFINRRTFRTQLTEITHPDSRHRALSLLGDQGSGKSYSYNLIRHVAESHGMGLALLRLKEEQSLDEACRQIAEDMGLDADAMEAKVVVDGAAEATRAQKFANWLFSTTRDRCDPKKTAPEPPQPRFVLMVDEIFTQAGTTYELYDKLVEPLLKKLRTGSAYHLVIVLVGKTVTVDSVLAPFFVQENVEPMTDSHVGEYIEQFALNLKTKLTDTDILQIKLTLTEGATGTFDSARMKKVSDKILPTLNTIFQGGAATS